MKSFAATVQIAATPIDVWNALLRTADWPSWDPALDRVDGSFAEGGTLAFHVRGQSRPFASKVATWQPHAKVVLRGGMPLGLFTGTRTYELTESETGTRFDMVERFTGPLAGLIGRSIPDLQPSFDAFASGLREAVEAHASGT